MGNSLWIEDTESFLVEALLKQVEEGNRTENGFNKRAWAIVVTELNEAFKEVLEKPITVAQAKSKEVMVCLFPN